MPSLTISAIALALVAYTIVQVILDMKIYSKGSGFTSPDWFFGGTFFSFLLMGLYVGCVNERKYILFSSLFYVFYWLFVLNLTIRAEYYVNRAYPSIVTGAFWLFLSVGIVLILLSVSPCPQYLGIILAWLLYVMWNWCYH